MAAVWVAVFGDEEPPQPTSAADPAQSATTLANFVIRTSCSIHSLTIVSASLI